MPAVEAVVEGADHGGEHRATEEAGEVHRRDAAERRHPRHGAAEEGDRAADDEEGDRHGDAAAARDGRLVDPSMIGVIQDPDRVHEPPHERGRKEGHGRGKEERGDDDGDG